MRTNNIEEWVNDVGPGWRDIVLDTDRRLRELAPDYEITQIKEKFGGLRYYIGSVPTEVYDQVYEVIYAAEGLSYEVCEECGATENVKTAGVDQDRKWSWIKTLCGGCRQAGKEGR